MSKGTDPWRTDIENELAHQQCALVVQDHGVDEAKVVGLSCWSYIVLMGSMDIVARRHCWRWTAVMHVMVPMPMGPLLRACSHWQEGDQCCGKQQRQRAH